MNHSHTLFIAVALLFPLHLTRAADWPNYRGPSFNGASSEKLAASSWPASGPRQLWKIPTPGGFSSFVVANGRVFTVVMRSFDGIDREVVVALDAQSGKELWARPLSLFKADPGGDSGARDNRGGDGPRSTPTVNGDRVYAIDVKLVLFCLDAATGKEEWRKDILAEHKGRNISWQNAASPVIEGQLLFVAGGGEGQALLGIDKLTGKTVWKGHNDKMTHATPVVTSLLGKRQVVFLTQTGLVAVEPADGIVLWRQDVPYATSTAASPVIAGDIVYVSAGYGVGAGAYRISQEGGRFRSKEIWRTPNKLMNHWSTPVVHEGHLYGLFGFKEYGECPLKCVELATGKEKWSQEGFGPGNVTLVDGHLIVLGDAGQLVLVKAQPTEYLEKARANVLEGKCWSTPTYSAGMVYARSTIQGVCLELSPKVATQ